MTGTTVSHYRILEELGRGGMGVVYKAVDANLDRDVALKFLPSELSADPVSKERFIQEAKAASGLDHPNICTIYDIGEAEDGRLFIAMAYYDGQTLKNLIEEGSLPADRAASIASQIAEGLQKSHSANIVHRDIKPANIMVTSEGRVKILDFGLAKLGAGIDLTKKGSTVGTTAYMSPEQVRGETIDARSDLWSLGVLLYEMLSGRMAFTGEYEQAVLYSVMNEAPEPLADNLPAGLKRVVHRLLKKDPSERFSSASEVVEALEPFTGSSSSQATASPSSKPALVTNRMATIAGTILLIAVAIWAYTNLGGREVSPVAPQRDAIAVLPFAVQGDESLKSFGEGMVTLLSNQLDGSGTLRAIDPNALLGYIARHPNLIIDPDGGREVADEFGAGRYILGAVVTTGDKRVISATLYEGQSVKVSEARVSFSEGEEFFEAFDDLSIQLLGHLIEKRYAEYWLATVRMTHSYPALKSYINAISLIREALYADGLAAAQATVEADSSFVLGWVAILRASSWLGRFDVMNAAFQEVRKRVDKLPDRFQPYLRAAEFFTQGRTQQAATELEGLLLQYPEDIFANGYLADYILHSPNQGLSVRQSMIGFERVQKYDPGNVEFALHRFELYARFDEREKLDSLVGSWEASQFSEMRDIHRILTGDSATQAEFLDRYGSAAGLSGQLIQKTLLRIGRYDLTEALLERLISSASGPELSDYRFRLSTALAAQGKMAAFDDILDIYRAEDPAGALSARFFKVLMSIRDSDLNRLREIENAVTAWDTLAAPLTNPDEQGNHAAVRAYMVGMLRWKMGDFDELRRQRDLILAASDGVNLSVLARSLERELSALIVWQDEGPASAIEVLSEAIPRDQYYVVAGSVFLGRPTLNWLMSEMLLDDDRDEEALPWMETYGANVLSHIWSGPSQLRQAEIYDQLGDTDEAIRLYMRVTRQWENADSEFQPRVREAQNRLNTLLDAKAREPG